jgi:hypothetical protein
MIAVLSIAVFLIYPKLVLLSSSSSEQKFDLVNNGWSFVSESNATLQVCFFKPTKYYFLRLKGRAQVPGDIYQDLYRLELIPDPLTNDNDVELRWVATHNWTYSTQYSISSNDLAVVYCLKIGFNFII